MSVDHDKERAAFEEWYEADAMPCEHSNWFKRDPMFPEMYDMSQVEQAWSAWIARANYWA